jgi:hypothetical protein
MIHPPDCNDLKKLFTVFTWTAFVQPLLRDCPGYETWKSGIGTGTGGDSGTVGTTAPTRSGRKIRAVGPAVKSERADYSEGSVLAEEEARFAADCVSEDDLELASGFERKRAAKTAAI